MSTSKQDMSPAVQSAAIERFCAAEGMDLVAVYYDLGASGAAEIADRPGLAAALAALQSGQALVAAKRDRFGVASGVERFAANAGARTYAADGMCNGGAALPGLSAHERPLIKRRMRDALATKKAPSERLRSIPYGKRVTADGVHLETNPFEQAVIDRAKALSDEGLSLRAIAAKLTEEGVRGRTGRPLSSSQVHRCLRGRVG
jgi:DNA invertase Pin-like site-specific DNA recombinase